MRWIEGGMTRSDFVRVDHLAHPDAALALHFWQKRPIDGIHMGRDVPSRDIARLLSRVLIYEAIDGGEDFKVHLAGSSVQQRFGRDITGESISQLFSGGDLPVRYEALKEVVWLDEPRMARIVHRIGKVDVLTIELLQVPIVAPNGSDRWVLTFVFYT